MIRPHACAAALLAMTMLVTGCASDPEALAYSQQYDLGPNDIMQRLDLTKEQETLVWPVVRRRLTGQDILLRDARNGEDVVAQLEKERHDAEISLDGVLNASQWVEWNQVEDQLGAQVLAER